MRIVFGADDENDCTAAVLAYLREVAEVEVADGGGDAAWTVFPRLAGETVARGDADRAVLMCWTGTGVSIAANKVPGVRAALAWEPWIAEHARRWNDANVLALSLKRLAPDVAVECVRAFLAVEAADLDEQPTIDRLAGL